MEDTLLEVQHLKKYFETGRGTLHAVDDISFSIGAGKTIGVVGESGCGKSTLGRTILHLLDPTDGKILFHGKDVTKVNKQQLKELRENMQIIFQDPYSSLNPRMTVSEALKDPLKISGKFNAEQMEDRVEYLMETVGLADRLYNSYPHELDGGRRQRVGVARALALEPEFIVCDEPVSALDVSIQAQILNLLQDLQEAKNLTYMFITHDLSVVRYISDEIIVMYMGQMVEKSPAKELFKNPVHPYTKALLSAILEPNIHTAKVPMLLKGEVSSPIDPKPGCRFAPRCQYACPGCSQAQHPVEVSPGHIVVCDVVTGAK